MPELPEVETIAQSLIRGQGGSGGLLGRRVARARVAWARTVAAPSAAGFQRRIAGQQVLTVGRRGKFIHIELDDYSLLIHLRMSGDLLLGMDHRPLGTHSRLQLYFDNGLQLSFQDPRKFGRAWLAAAPPGSLPKDDALSQPVSQAAATRPGLPVWLGHYFRRRSPLGRPPAPAGG